MLYTHTQNISAEQTERHDRDREKTEQEVVEELKLERETEKRLSEDEARLLAGKLLKILALVRQIVVDLSLRRRLPRQIMPRMFWDLYKEVLEVLVLLDRDKMIRRIKGDINIFSELFHEVRERIDYAVRTFTIVEPVQIDVELYVPLLVRLALQVCERAREVLTKNVGPLPEIDALLYELRQILPRVVHTDIFDFLLRLE